MAEICVVMATFNGERYLPQMLDSLAAQKRPADLVIAVDDGSSDSTRAILESYQQKLPLKIHACMSNQGHNAAFSKGLELAAQEDGDYIALADQDDVWLPEKLAILEKKMEAVHPDSDVPVLVFGDAQVVAKNLSPIANSWRKMANLPTSIPVLARLAGFNNITGCLSIFDKSLLNKILPIPANAMVHDAWIGIIAAKFGKILAIPDILIQYRLHDSNAVGTGTHYSYDETTQKQICAVETLLEDSDKLNLNEKETKFLTVFCSYLKAREGHYFLFTYTFWLWKHKKELFPQNQGCTKKLLFSLLGAKAVHLFFGKNK